MRAQLRHTDFSDVTMKDASMFKLAFLPGLQLNVDNAFSFANQSLQIFLDPFDISSVLSFHSQFMFCLSFLIMKTYAKAKKEECKRKGY